MKLILSDFFVSGILLIAMLEGCQNKEVMPGEGFIDVPGGKVWYRIYGEGNKSPVLALHGGPGSSSFGIEPIEALAKDRKVILFDQLGCGRSTRITDTTLMTVEHYVEEVELVRKALQLEDFYLFGQSWGGTLAMDYYLKYPAEVKAIIFSSPLLSTDLWIKDADTLIATLPDSIQFIIRENEKNKTFGSESYKNAVNLYYSKFLWRKGRTQSQIDSSEMFTGTNVYEFMWGPSEFTATGNLLNYDRVKNLPDIAVPTLLLAGEYDEARPGTVRYFQSRIPGSEFVEIKDSGHATMNDNPVDANAAMSQFIQKVD